MSAPTVSWPTSPALEDRFAQTTPAPGSWKILPFAGLMILGVSAVVTVLGWFFFFVGMVKIWF